jgi:hypothetical protein
MRHVHTNWPSVKASTLFSLVAHSSSPAPVKSIYHLAIALMFAFTVDLSAAVPAGKAKQLTAPDEVPQGLAKSDWTSIRAAYEAGRHAFQPVGGGWQARNPGQQWTTKFDGRGFTAEPKSAGWQWGLELKSYGFVGHERAISGKPSVKADGQRLSYDWNAAVQEWFVNDARGLEHGFTVRQRPTAGTDAAATLQFDLAVRGPLTPHVTEDALAVEFRDASGAEVLHYAGLKVWDTDGKILPAHFAAADGGVRLLVDERGARYPITVDPIAQQAYLKASNAEANDGFGFSVAVSGDTVVVGAYQEDGSGSGVNRPSNNLADRSGAAYVFVRIGTNWNQQAYLKASNTGVDDFFGFSVAVSGDTVVVGAPFEDGSGTGVNPASNNLADSAGAAYVFVRSGTSWSQQAYLKASNAGVQDEFGYTVAVSGDTIVVGSHEEDSSGTGIDPVSNELASDAGAAYVFVRSGTSWGQQAYLKASNTGADDHFGRSAAVSGDTVVIGSPAEGGSGTGVNPASDELAVNAGAAYVFVRSGTSWSQQAYLKASNSDSDDIFGHAVAVAGDTVVVGAYQEAGSGTGVNPVSDEGTVSAGAAYVFVRSGTSWSQQAYLKASNTEILQEFGGSVAVSGDIVVVGAPLEDGSGTGVNPVSNSLAYSAGAAYVFVRSGTSWSQQAYLKASNTGIDDHFGFSVGVSGGTVVAGAYLEDGSGTGINPVANNLADSAGAAYTFVGFGPAQEIAMEQPVGTALTDGISSIAFGSLNVGVSSASSTFTIKNMGPAALTISGVAVTGGNAGDFNVDTTGMLSSVPATTGSTTFTVTFTPSAAETRSTTLQVVSDDYDEATFDIALTGTGLNNVPTISDIGSQTINEDSTATGLAFTVGDVETAVGALTMTGTSNNIGLVPNGNIVFGGSGANRTLAITPLPNQFGSATVTITVSDGTASTSDTFLLTVNGVNDGPTLAAISNPAAIPEDAGTQSINLSGISAGPGEAQALTVTATSNNLSLIPNPAIIYSSPDATALLSYTPVTNASGSALITVMVNDGQAGNNLTTQTFTVFVTAVNDPPTITDIADQTINEDANSGELAFNIGDVETEAVSLTVSGASSNTALVPNANITFGGSGTSRTVTVTPAANQFGTATFTVTVNDGTASTSDTFLLTINPVNDAPTLAAISNPSAILEDAGMRTVNMSGISAGPGESQVLTVTATSDNPGLIPNPMVTYTSPNSTGSLSYTPAANANGSAVITVTVDDGQASNNIATQTFTVTVTSVNDVPTISDITNQNINEDGNTGALAFTIGDVETATASIAVSGSSSNTALVPTANIVFGGSEASRTVTVMPAANQFGTATITVTVSDGTASTSDTFLLTVNSVNDVPTISDIADQTINEDTNTGALSFTVGDVETSVTSLTVSRTSSNTVLVPTANVVIGGSGVNRTVAVTPAPNQFGTATITVTVSDGSASTSDTFLLTVDPVNDAPTITAVSNQTIDEDTGSGARAFTIGDVETASASLTLAGSSSNAALVPDANIIFVGSGASRTVTITPLANQFGATTITITVSDGVATASRTFVLTVNSVNDLPTISDVGNRTINEDAATGTLSFTVDDLETDAVSLTVSGSSSNSTLVPNGNIVFSGSGASRSVVVTPVANKFGSATITLTVSDDTETASDTFVLTVTSVNDVPTITNITDRTINEDGNTGAIAFTIGDVETAVTSLAVNRSSSNTALVPNSSIVLGGSGANRTVSVSPASNQSGTTTITVTVSDGTATVNDTFLLTVNAENDAPTISNITDQSISVNTLTNSLPFTVGDVEMAAAALTVSGTSSNQVLVTDENIFFGGSGASRTVTVIPESNQIGSTTITVTVSDGELTSSYTFIVNVVAPEIAVEQPFTSNLADGGTRSFGSVAVGANTSLTFFIKNTGTADLTGLTMTQDGADSAMFTITANPSAPVSGPDGNTAFTVRFGPTSVGLKTAAIHIANNDLDESLFDITLTGIGVIPLTDWRQQYFGSTTNSGDGADLSDYDDDGLPNLVEYAFGLNPKQNSAGKLPQAQIGGGNFGFNFTEPDGVTGISYGAEWSATMAVDDWHAITDTGTAPQHTFSVPIGSNTGLFIRLKVTSP